MVPEGSRRVVASLSVKPISPQGAIGNFGGKNWKIVKELYNETALKEE